MWAKTTIGVRCRAALQVVLQPLELLGAELAEAAGLEVHDVDQADEVHAVVVEAVPAGALGALAVALEIELALLVDDVVLAGDVDARRAWPADDSIGVVEFLGLGQMA